MSGSDEPESKMSGSTLSSDSSSSSTLICPEENPAVVVEAEAGVEGGEVEVGGEGEAEGEVKQDSGGERQILTPGQQSRQVRLTCLSTAMYIK